MARKIHHRPSLGKADYDGETSCSRSTLTALDEQLFQRSTSELYLTFDTMQLGLFYEYNW